MLFVFFLMTLSTTENFVKIDCLKNLDIKFEEMQIIFSYYIYSVFIRYSELNYIQIYETYYKSLITQKEKILYFEKTNLFFNDCSRNMCNNSIPLEYEKKILKPIHKFIKNNPLLLNDKNNIIRTKHESIRNNPYKIKYFISCLLADFVVKVVYNVILLREDFEYFIEYVGLIRTGYYYPVQKSKKIFTKEHYHSLKEMKKHKISEKILFKTTSEFQHFCYKIFDLHLVYLVYIYYKQIFYFRSKKMLKTEFLCFLKDSFSKKCDWVSLNLVKEVEYIFLVKLNMSLRNKKICTPNQTYKFIFRDKNVQEKELFYNFFNFLLDDDEIGLLCTKYIHESVDNCYKDLNKLVIEKNEEIEGGLIFIYKSNA